uniref:Gypsy retrotransposon integrase-like protein 1 n=1 Tax=Paramormyrops kingsleyae TaxID=1676925 RepID=A0A3B3RYT1_9TELE
MHFATVPLQAPTARLTTYLEEPISVLGCLHSTVSKFGLTCPAHFFIVEHGTALLGMDLIKGLKLQFDGHKVLSPPHVASVCTLSSPPLKDVRLGCVKYFTHKVNVSDSVLPIRCKLRRLPFSVRDAVSIELRRLPEADVIEEIDSSPWVSPVMVVQKKTGGIRMCVDLRGPNKAITVDSYPLPHMEVMMTLLQGADTFSTIDLESAYHQVPLHEDSRDLTAFITHKGLFRFKRVPYGLASAPAAFQKMIAIILDGLQNVANYLDDIIVWGRTVQEHDLALQNVLQRLRDAGLQLNNSKCQFRKQSLKFLGHKVTAQGIQVDQEHLSAILDAPVPSDAVQLRSLIGLLSWYNKFIPNFASVVVPLRACLKAENGFCWSEDAQNSLTEVKKLLVNSPALALFHPEWQVVISTDASAYGLGAVFSQIVRSCPSGSIAFASRTLSTAEQKYSTVEKEALACVWAVEKWRTYLWGRRFILRTDHQALTTLLTTKGTDCAGMRIARWATRLLCFDYSVEYRAGSENYTADCLSRLPLPFVSDTTSDAEPEFVTLVSTALTAISKEEFATASASCPELSALRMQISRSWPASLSALDPVLQPYYKLRAELSVQADFVFRGARLIVPGALRDSLVHIAHEGHQGIVRTKQRLRDIYWWPKMDINVMDKIAACQLCLSLDKTTKVSQVPLQPVPLPSAPWEKLAIDIVGPFETAVWDCRYAITLTDYYSKWPEVAFTASITTKQVTSFLTTVFSRHGNPTTIVSDNGPQFTSPEFAAFLKGRNIAHVRTANYHPSANGAVERFHRVLKSTIQSAILQSASWKVTVTDFLQVYRATPHAITGVSPFELLHGRKMRTSLDVLAPPSAVLDPSQLRKRVLARQEHMKLRFDHSRHVRPTCMHVMKAHPKFTPPVEVKEKVGSYTYLLEDGKKWHASCLAPVPDVASKGTGDTETEQGKPSHAFLSGTSESVPPGKCQSRKPAWLTDYVS